MLLQECIIKPFESNMMKLFPHFSVYLEIQNENSDSNVFKTLIEVASGLKTFKTHAKADD